ncbi:MAG TPA: hypothetical protein VGO60_08190 [Iamia sp.]|jgi:hypothetical protein|nr:hypothetical protein [Iamia sp.]
MDIDLASAERFVATHGRLLDRHRLACLLHGGDADRQRLHAAVEAYRNPDGGYGWGLEPDLRDGTSQPGPSLHAFEAWVDAGPPVGSRAVELCDWLASIALDDGALPFGLPVDDRAGTAPFWAEADPTEPSLQITAAVVTQAHRVARIDPAVATHPWLGAATRWCVDAVRALDQEPFALVLGFAVNAVDGAPEPSAALDHLRPWIPEDGIVAVAGGAEGECLRPLDLAPRPDRPARSLITAETVAADVVRLAGQQQDDGGWPLEWNAYSPAAELEWRGHVTVNAIDLLQANGVLTPPACRA